MTNRHYSDKDFKKKAKDFVSEFNFPHEDCVSQLIQSVLKIGNVIQSESDLKLLKVSLEELRKTFKLFQKHRDSRKIAIFGSARSKPTSKNYILTEKLAKDLSSLGFFIITGAGPGIMEAGNKGALNNKSIGLNIELPFEQTANQYIVNTNKLISYKYFFTRKLAFIKESDGIILLPGGFGTHDEGFEVLTLIQTGRCSPRPIVLTSKSNSTYWETWINYIDTQLYKRNYISKDDLSIFYLSKSRDDIINYIQTFYKVYHSIRYLKKHTVIRLNHTIETNHLSYINKTFSHLLESGKFELKPAKTLSDDNEFFKDKMRLVFNFNRSDYGGLYPLIHYLNSIDIT
ncbi:cytochrome D ubiquinol oxidase subunit II [Candidatus Marinamargulisbacteria bacterium SCGC AG-410-N11]|nr:cytochrome D ubiquinol oxidase subunit II [Candidatus Marinamargulisbacteria bacterium SCGC AG-410-N11]